MTTRVLIVDDAPDVRDILRYIFSRHGWDVVGEAEDGDAAIELYRELRPDVVTMDIHMGERDGISTLKHIMAEHPGARVVMCSTVSSRLMIVEALQSGAKEFVTKPFLKEGILDAVERAVRAVEAQAS